MALRTPGHTGLPALTASTKALRRDIPAYNFFHISILVKNQLMVFEKNRGSITSAINKNYLRLLIY